MENGSNTHETLNENIAGACVYSMRIEFNLRHKVHIPIVFGRFFVNSHKKSQNGSGDSNRSIRFDDNKNAYF